MRSPPIASSSATSSGRRTMLTVFRPRVFAKAITHRPTPELAAFCTTHSPGFRSTYSLSRWEEKIDSDTPNLKLADGTALEPLATKKLQRKLKPIFETIVERTTF